MISQKMQNSNDDLGKQLKQLHKKVNQFTTNMVKFFEIEELKAEFQSMKPCGYTRTFVETVSTAIASERVFSNEAQKSTFRIRTKGLHEAEGETGDAKLEWTRRKWKKLDFLEIESKVTIINDRENDIDKDMLKKSAHKLKTPRKFLHLSSTVMSSTEDIEKENEDSKLRRDLIKKGVLTEVPRIRNLKLQKLVRDV